jgi:hypothetical protein
MDINNENSGNYQKNLSTGSAFERQEESIKMLAELAQKQGIEIDSGNFKKILKFSEFVRVDVKSLLRILTGEQTLTPQQRKRIRYLYDIEFGKVYVRVPPAELIPPKIIPPEPLRIAVPNCSLLIHIDALEHDLTAYFGINYMDFLIKHIEYMHYDGAIEPPRNYLNGFFANFMRVKDKSMSLVESELSMEVRYDEECPKKYRMFEMEMIEIETETLRYGLKYANGRVLKSVGNLPIKEIVRILKSVGAWE